MSGLTRRRFLGAAAGAGAVSLLGGPQALFGQSPHRGTPLAVGGRFRQSVASGQATPRGITLWTRVEDLERTSRLQVEIARDADFARVIQRKTVLAKAGRDYSVHHRADLPDLQPGEQYFYRFFTCDESSPVGRFRTALPPDSREPVRVGFFSCQNYAAGFFTALQGLAAEPDLDLVVCLGDYIYEQTGQTFRADRTGRNRDSDVQLLPEYREKYRLYHSDPRLLALRERFPLMTIWDDHESENNNAGDQESPNPGERNLPTGRRTSYLQRRANAYQAFFEHMPRIQLREEPHRIYGTLRLGANADLLLVDERQYRDPQPCGDRVASPCSSAERNDPGRTLLGAAQKAWLKRELESSRAAWKIVGNQVMIMSLDVPARNPVNPDQWDGYGAERRELMSHLQARGIGDVSFLTGDIHTFFAGNVTPSGREGVPALDGTPAATEFVGGSVTSPGLEETFPSEGAAGELGTETGIRANNLHIAQANLSRRGYGVLEARPDELLVQFRSPRTVRERSSQIDTIARFRVARGNPRVQRL